MKSMAQSPRKQRLLFFTLGLSLAVVCALIAFFWMSIVPYEAFGQQPAWLKGLRRIVGWLPWIAVAIVLVLMLVKGRRIRVGFFFLGTLVPTVVLIAWLLCADSLADVLHRQTFDAATWHNQDSVEHDIMWPPRLCMVDDLMSSGRLNGLDRNQVLDLLGPPHDKSFPFGARDCDIHYYLGPERGFIRIDSEWLFITFGNDGKVSRHWLYRD